MLIVIHACHARMWYVRDFLVPALRAQGIGDGEIRVWQDWTGAGNLLSCVDCFRACGLLPEGAWHLQDDVLPSRRFAELARANDEGVVCGFCNEDFGPDAAVKGTAPVPFMWNGFQCVRVPAETAEEFARWFYTEAQRRPGAYQRYIAERKYDDTFWRDFMQEWHGDGTVLNLAPNIVEHVDWLIGGSVINKGRLKQQYRSAYWEDEDLVEELGRKISARG